MNDSDFVAYVGDSDIHDAQILSIDNQGCTVDVHLRGASRRNFVVRFVGVQSVASNRPEGMMLYALVERRSAPPCRRFDFANWEDEDDARLEIMAEGFSILQPSS
jgi:hypothetical protein